MMGKPTEGEITAALSKVEAVVLASNNVSDSKYFMFHKKRYLRMARTIASRTVKNSTVLNLGSHYLHTSLLFKFMGYTVSSLDVDVFWELDFVKERKDTFGLIEIRDNDFETFASHEEISEKYDVITFAEIMEHITFNPINFWKSIYKVTKPGGIIYISTPNSLNLYNIVRTIARIITFRGVGLPVGSIFDNVTYGHHWKEYSTSEIRKYFSALTTDFEVETSLYHYRSLEFGGIYSSLFSVISTIGNSLYFFSDEIEAIVTVRKTGKWNLKSPDY